MATKATDHEDALFMDSLAYYFLTNPDLVPVVERWLSGELLRHEFLEKLELLKDAIIAQHRDPHNPRTVCSAI